MFSVLFFKLHYICRYTVFFHYQDKQKVLYNVHHHNYKTRLRIMLV